MVRGFCYTRDMRNPLRKRASKFTVDQIVELMESAERKGWLNGLQRGEQLGYMQKVDDERDRGWDQCVAVIRECKQNNRWKEYQAIVTGEVDRTTTTENRN